MTDVDVVGVVDVEIGRGDVDASISGEVSVKEAKKFLSVSIATPLVINVAKIEYVKGGIDSQTNMYGLQIVFCSGHDLWLHGDAAIKFATELMECLGCGEDTSAVSQKLKKKIS